MKKINIILILIIIIIIFVIFNLLFSYINITNNKLVFEQKYKLYNINDCKIKEEIFKINGFSMEPLILNWSDIKVFMNYYNCDNNIPKSWDIVIFENPYTLEKIIKKIMIVPKDKIEINKEKRTIKANWKVLKNSLDIEYIFYENELKWFEIYLQDGEIIWNTYFLFWDNIYNSRDSRDFWPITLEWILWKVEIKK